MSCESPLPDRCQGCAKSHHRRIHRSCRFCADLGLIEEIFCDLNRSVQANSNNFECGAFQPRLSIVKEQGFPESPPVIDRATRRNALAERLADLRQMKSSKVQYQKALSLEKLESEPDAIFCQVKFHMAWSVIERRSVFADTKKHLDVIPVSLFQARAPSVTDIQLLWLAPDHLHVYCESDGTASPEEIVVHLKSASEKALMADIADVLPDTMNPQVLWDKSYFMESIA